MISTGTASADSGEEYLRDLIGPHEVGWLYRPVSFVLKTNSRGVVLDGFCPDFYLPGQNLYVKIATFRQKLRGRIRQRTKRLKKLYPHIEVRTVSPRDFHKLIQGCI